jgi:hypothetical protein
MWTRSGLFADDATRKPLSWHDLRGTCATWMAVRGNEPLRIQHRLEHRNYSTTDGYVVEAEQIRQGFGETFPALPPELLQARASRTNSAESITRNDHSAVSIGNYRAGHGVRPG